MNKKTNPKTTVDLKSTSTEPITLSIDGRTYNLCWKFSAICKAEQDEGHGCNLLTALFHLGRVDSSELRGLLRAFLLPMQPNITVLQVDDMIRIDTMESILTAMGAVITASASKPKADASGATVSA